MAAGTTQWSKWSEASATHQEAFTSASALSRSPRGCESLPFPMFDSVPMHHSDPLNPLPSPQVPFHHHVQGPFPVFPGFSLATAGGPISTVPSNPVNYVPQAPAYFANPSLLPASAQALTTFTPHVSGLPGHTPAWPLPLSSLPEAPRPLESPVSALHQSPPYALGRVHTPVLRESPFQVPSTASWETNVGERNPQQPFSMPVVKVASSLAGFLGEGADSFQDTRTKPPYELGKVHTPVVRPQQSTDWYSLRATYSGPQRRDREKTGVLPSIVEASLVEEQEAGDVGPKGNERGDSTDRRQSLDSTLDGSQGTFSSSSSESQSGRPQSSTEIPTTNVCILLCQNCAKTPPKQIGYQGRTGADKVCRKCGAELAEASDQTAKLTGEAVVESLEAGSEAQKQPMGGVKVFTEEWVARQATDTLAVLSEHCAAEANNSEVKEPREDTPEVTSPRSLNVEVVNQSKFGWRAKAADGKMKRSFSSSGMELFKLRSIGSMKNSLAELWKFLMTRDTGSGSFNPALSAVRQFGFGGWGGSSEAQE